MPKQIDQQEFDAIISAILAFSQNGASIEDILKTLHAPPPRRSLQRRLAMLVKAKRLSMNGHGRAIRYQLSSQDQSKVVYYHIPTPSIHDLQIDQVREPQPDFQKSDESYVPISSVGLEIKQNVRRPIHERKPVSYNRELLDAYIPNVTEYLSPNIQQHLYKIGHVPDGEKLAGTYARQMLNRLLIDLSWNSSRLEGNTYSLLETERLLALGETAQGKNKLESQMILNHKAAIEFLVDMAVDIGCDRYTIFNLHALLATNLLSPTSCGRLRHIPVGISKTVYYPSAIPRLIEECFFQILNTANAIVNPFEQAFFLMVHLPYLQPFEDVNKRVSRLAANIPFIKNNFCPLSFIDVPERPYIDGILGVYELNQIELLRDVFVWAYERSADRYSAVCRSVGEPDPLRLRYHALITNVITAVVQDCLNKKNADIYIKQQADILVPKQDRARFVEVVEIELLELHEGNIARFRVRLAEFRTWHANWR